MPGGARSSASARSTSRRSRAAAPAIRFLEVAIRRDGSLGEGIVKTFQRR
jgi:hypothetical protein